MSRGLTNAERLIYALSNFIYALGNNEFLELDIRTSLEHFSIEMLNNKEVRSCTERKTPELNDDIARTSEYLLVMATNTLEQANELGIPPIPAAFDAYLNGVDARTLRARYAPLVRAAAAATRPKGEPQGSP